MSSTDYLDRFKHLRMEKRDNGVLEIAFHTNGGPVIFGLPTYKDLYGAFTAITADRSVKAIVLTGAGDAFIGGADLGDPKVSGTPEGFDEFYWHCRQMQQRFLEIEALVVCALNGPVLLHTELPLLCDSVVAVEDAYFQDSAHIPGNIVPGDGAHVVWEEVLGPVGAKYFLLTSQKITARVALDLRAVNEVVSPDQLLPRARELADKYAALPLLTARYTRLALNQRLRRRFLEGVPLGMALEGITVFKAMGSSQ
jgi:enoyl-CoA hydratase/carnithine racemase